LMLIWIHAFICRKGAYLLGRPLGWERSSVIKKRGGEKKPEGQGEDVGVESFAPVRACSIAKGETGQETKSSRTDRKKKKWTMSLITALTTSSGRGVRRKGDESG